MKQIEILAPAGSYESLKAAINAGCDAVYLGGNKFGARAYANNLSEEDLLRAIDYVHLHDKKLYLTINTLLKNSELKSDLYNYLEKYYEQGLDAVIIQDIGVMNFVRKYFPELSIHASTQMTLTMAEGVKVFEELGVTRLVTSRELHLDEIKEIHNHTNLEIESFVHGALCFCYSGQCFMSSMLGGRSGNRGRCAQPCRMQYRLEGENKILSNKEEKYLLSPKDICTISLIPELIEAGIDSFKIEGRMKRPEYTAYVSYLYRKYADLYLNLGKSGYKEYISKNKDTFEKDTMKLLDLYNRGGFTSGYYHMHNGKNMMANNRPNHSGVLIGEIVSVKGNNASILLKEEVNSQDILEIRIHAEQEYEFTLKDGAKKGNTIRTNFSSQYKVKPGQLVYRTKNNKLLESIQEDFLKTDKKVPICGFVEAKLGQPLKLTLLRNDIQVTVYGDPVEQAMKQPVTSEKIKDQLKKTNTTEFIFEQLEVESDDKIFIPVVKLNEIRRIGIETLTDKILSLFRRNFRNKGDNVCIDETINKELKNRNETGICVQLHQFDHLDEVIKYKEVNHIYFQIDTIDLNDISTIVSKVKKSGKKLYLVLPNIFRKETYELFQNHKDYLKDPGIAGYIIKNYEEYQFIHNELGNTIEKEIILDYNVYTFNEEAKEFWMQKGVTHFTSSIELNYQELKELGIQDSDIIVYGHLPLMVTAQCMIRNSQGCTRKTQKTKLIDRYNKDFIVSNNCNYCYNVIYNGNPISLLENKDEIMRLNPKNIRLDFTFEDKNEVNDILDAFVQVFKYNKLNQTIKIKNFTRGHFKRGVE